MIAVPQMEVGVMSRFASSECYDGHGEREAVALLLEEGGYVVWSGIQFRRLVWDDDEQQHSAVRTNKKANAAKEASWKRKRVRVMIGKE